MRAWLAQHRDAARLAWRRFATAPLNSLLSLLAIGVVLALPATGQMLLAAAGQLGGGVAPQPQISVFLAADAERSAATEVESRLKRFGGVKHAQFIPREETLARLKSNPGMRDVIDALPGNPFPDAFVVTTDDDRAEAMERLAAEFRRWPKVEHVQLDSAWVRRLDALLKLGRTLLLLLGGLIGAGLVAISFSLIRMQVLAHRAEIEVSRLLGATDAFVRRPFLYFGTLLGLGGGMVAWSIAAMAAFGLRTPLADVGRLYDFALIVEPLALRDAAILVVFAAALGWLGAATSLRRQLRET